MKHLIKSAIFTFTFLLFAGIAFAQVPSNSALIFPLGQPVFNPNGQFTGIGESGGVPGPTANGCDLYGFRAQLNSNIAVNLGIQSELGVNTPVLTYESALPFVIEAQNSVGGGIGGVTGCGKIMAFYFDNNNINYPLIDNVYTAAGGISATGFYTYSDRKLKRNIKSISSALDMVSQLRGVTYEYRRDERPELNLAKGTQYGYIVQEVAQVMPEAVRNTFASNGEVADFKVMNYTMVIPVLSEAINEQQDLIEGQNMVIANLEAVIEDQENTIDDLSTRLARLEKLMNKDLGSAIAPSSVDLNTGSFQGVSLRQNRPNPFKGVTQIQYTLPEDMSNARLVVYDVNGQELKGFNLSVGSGTVEYNAADLASGIYFYAIVANGQSLARQKMIVK